MRTFVFRPIKIDIDVEDSYDLYVPESHITEIHIYDEGTFGMIITTGGNKYYVEKNRALEIINLLEEE